MNLRTRLWEWGHKIPGEKYMQMTIPSNKRLRDEAKSDWIAEYGNRYELVRIFLMTSQSWGIHFRKLALSSGKESERK